MLGGAGTLLPEVEPSPASVVPRLMPEGNVVEAAPLLNGWFGAGVRSAVGLEASSWDWENVIAAIPHPSRMMKDHVTTERRLIFDFGWSPQQWICDLPLPQGQSVVGFMASPLVAGRGAVGRLVS